MEKGLSLGLTSESHTQDRPKAAQKALQTAMTRATGHGRSELTRVTAARTEEQCSPEDHNTQTPQLTVEASSLQSQITRSTKTRENMTVFQGKAKQQVPTAR